MNDNDDPGMLYPHVVSTIMNTPWAILPGTLATILDLIAFRAAGGRLTHEEIQARIGAVAKPQLTQTGQIAVLPLFGVISHRANTMSEMSGGTSTEQFASTFRALLADPQIAGIVLDIDSPGGTVQGVDELSAEIYTARGRKPIAAIASPLAVSAAYWIGTAADSLSVIPSGEVGSIGVLAAHSDISRALERVGIKTSLISAGKYKTEGSPYEPLGEEARGAIQERVNDYYDMFTAAVARNRGVSATEVRGGFGQGRVVGAKQAKKLGMVDRIESLDEMVARMLKQVRGRGGATPKGAGADDLDLRARRLRLGRETHS